MMTYEQIKSRLEELKKRPDSDPQEIADLEIDLAWCESVAQPPAHRRDAAL